MVESANSVVKHLRRAALLQDGSGVSNGQLLGCFIRERDEAAFAALVRRHGALVWSVCRRLLGNDHDTEDAFQATFLVLVRKASSVLPREMLPNWLHGVAYHTALKARAIRARRRSREKQVTHMAEPAVAEKDIWSDLEPFLDQELNRLPDKYRIAIVLCDLQGKTRKQAALQLDCPEGTVAARLARGRALLAKRMARYGPLLSGVTLATLLTQHAGAGVPASIVSMTTQKAAVFAAGGALSPNLAALVQKVLTSMLMGKIKAIAAGLLAVCVLAAGVTLSAAAQTRTGLASQKKEVQKDPSELQQKRNGRRARWTIVFTYKGGDYAKELDALGAMIAVPTADKAKYEVIRDLKKVPAKPSIEELALDQHLFWTDTSPQSIQVLWRALGLQSVPAAIFVVFPKHIEEELLRQELAYGQRKEEEIEETRFRCKRTDKGHELKVISQRLKN